MRGLELCQLGLLFTLLLAVEVLCLRTIRRHLRRPTPKDS